MIMDMSALNVGMGVVEMSYHGRKGIAKFCRCGHVKSDHGYVYKDKCQPCEWYNCDCADFILTSSMRQL